MKRLFLLAAFLFSDSLIPVKKKQLDQTIENNRTRYVAAEWEPRCAVCKEKVKSGVMIWYVCLCPAPKVRGEKGSLKASKCACCSGGQGRSYSGVAGSLLAETQSTHLLCLILISVLLDHSVTAPSLWISLQIIHRCIFAKGRQYSLNSLILIP